MTELVPQKPILLSRVDHDYLVASKKKMSRDIPEQLDSARRASTERAHAWLCDRLQRARPTEESPGRRPSSPGGRSLPRCFLPAAVCSRASWSPQAARTRAQRQLRLGRDRCSAASLKILDCPLRPSPCSRRRPGHYIHVSLPNWPWKGRKLRVS